MCGEEKETRSGGEVERGGGTVTVPPGAAGQMVSPAPTPAPCVDAPDGKWTQLSSVGGGGWLV